METVILLQTKVLKQSVRFILLTRLFLDPFTCIIAMELR
jgi:hypothetical protein